jgi:hypothetical protein
MTLLEELMELLKIEAPVFVPVERGEPATELDLCALLAAKLKDNQGAERDQVERALRSLAADSGGRTLKLLVRGDRILFISFYGDRNATADYREALSAGLNYPYVQRPLEVELQLAHVALAENVPPGAPVGEGSTKRIVAIALGVKERKATYLVSALQALQLIEILRGGHHATYRLLAEPRPITAASAREGVRLAKHRPALEEGVRDDSCARILFILRRAANPTTGRLARRPGSYIEAASRMGPAATIEHLSHLRNGGFVSLRGRDHYVRLAPKALD